MQNPAGRINTSLLLRSNSGSPGKPPLLLQKDEKMDNKYEALRLRNQLCFPLYAASREVVKKYTPYLDKLGLTYTQYITMMVLWEEQEISVKSLGEKLFLDSGTLTPLLKVLEKKGLVSRTRSTADERVLVVSATPEGMQLRDAALDVPLSVGSCINISQEDAAALYRILYKILGRE